MREEALNIEHEKRCLENDRKREEEVAKVKDEYRDKLEARLQTEVANIKEMYGEILQRLPKVTVRQFDGRHEEVGNKSSG